MRVSSHTVFLKNIHQTTYVAIHHGVHGSETLVGIAPILVGVLVVTGDFLPILEPAVGFIVGVGNV